MADRVMRVTVISPEAAMFEGDADAVVAPAFDGDVGILPGHAPFMTLLGHGILTVRGASGARAFRVRGGFLQVVDDRVRVVAESVEGDSHAA
jgi:F-type H+-transporting ATPase subunit epsilon